MFICETCGAHLPENCNCSVRRVAASDITSLVSKLLLLNGQVQRIQKTLMRSGVESDELEQLVDHLHESIQRMQRVAALIKTGEE